MDIIKTKPRMNHIHDILLLLIEGMSLYASVAILLFGEVAGKRMTQMIRKPALQARKTLI